MGISRDHWHKRRATGGKKCPIRKKRKFELARPAAMTKLAPQRIHTLRVRGGNKKYRALRLDTVSDMVELVSSFFICLFRVTSLGDQRLLPARPGSSTWSTMLATTSWSGPRPLSRTPSWSLMPPPSGSGRALLLIVVKHNSSFNIESPGS